MNNILLNDHESYPRSFRWILILPLICFIGIISAKSQDTPSRAVVDSPKGDQFDPVAITQMRAGSQVILPGQPFTPASDWVQSLQITAENRTRKTIVAINVNISFPETGTGSASRPIVGQQVRWGNRPVGQRTTRDGQAMTEMQKFPLSVGPGESVDLDLGSQYSLFSGPLQAALKGAPPHKCQLQLVSVSFSDDTFWAFGAYQRSVPGTPLGRERLSSDDFVAKPVSNH